MPSSRDYVTQWMETLRGCYPSGYFGKTEWAKTLQVWPQKLMRFDAWVFQEAADAVIKHHHKDYPSLGQVQEICVAIKLRREKTVGRTESLEHGREDLSRFRVPTSLPWENPFRVAADGWEANIRAGETLDGTECARTMQRLLDQNPIGEEMP